MGITKSDVKFLSYVKQRLGVSFENTLTLGRLYLYLEKNDVADVLKNKEKGAIDFKSEDGYSEPLFRILGAKQVDSMDYSGYEGASIIHDLNKPIPDNLKDKFTTIVDGGTIEHVFNFPTAIKNCMEALKVGGYYVGITPANNSCGHGFYQFSPELYFAVFSEDNGFKVKLMITQVQGEWYETADPSVVKSRVELTNSQPTTLLIVAQKISAKPIFEKTPQQSDYTRRWTATKTVAEVTPVKDGALKALYRKLPGFIKNLLRGIYVFLKKATVKKDTVVLPGLGKVKSVHYKKISID